MVMSRYLREARRAMVPLPRSRQSLWRGGIVVANKKCLHMYVAGERLECSPRERPLEMLGKG